MIESASDRLAFLDFDDFAVQAIYSGTGFPVIFDRESALLDLGEVGLESSRPVATARTEDVSAIASGSTITINGDPFKVTANRPDGTGFSILVLAEV